MRRVVLVLGVKGVGKSSVIERAFEGWKVINYGDLMMEILAEEGISRDEMSWKLNSKKYIELQGKALQKLVGLISNTAKDVVIDSHGMIQNVFGKLPGFPSESVKRLPLDMVFVIVAKPEEIYQRIVRDSIEKGRGRKLPSLEEIRERQEFEVLSAMMLSQQLGIPFEIIENPEGEIEKAVEKIKSILEVL